MDKEKIGANVGAVVSFEETIFYEDSSDTGNSPRPREDRWKEEAAFFDAEAQRAENRSLQLDPMAVQRYQSPRLKRRFNKEFRFRIMGSLEGKRVLDVGCGDGLNSAMLAVMGAEITGVDISPKSIELAQRRADENGVADKIKFICSPIETAELPEQYFDIIWGDSVLHHVLDELDVVLQRLHKCLKHDGMFVFAEPMNLFEPLRRLRRLVPVKTNGTSGERPLVADEVDRVARYTDKFNLRCFSLFGRMNRFILINHNYERSPAFRRMIVNAISWLDYFLLSLPVVWRLGGTCVMYGSSARA